MLKKDDSSVIKRILKKEKLTQKQLALMFNVSKQYLSQIVNSDKQLSSKIIDKIKQYYPDYLKDTKSLNLPKIIDVKFLEKFRNHYSYSTRKLSSLLGISPTMYSLILKGERNINETIINGIKFLNEHPNEKYISTKEYKKTSVKLRYIDILDNKSKNHVSFDKTLLIGRNYNQCIVTDLKIDSSHVWLNVYSKAIIDTSSKELKDNKQYLFKHNNHLYLVINNKKRECIALNKRFDTLNFSLTLEENYGEIIGFLQ